MLNTLRALYRLTVTLCLILAATLCILGTAPLPIKRQEIPLSAWMATWYIRMVLRLYHVHPVIPDANRLRQHHGFIFPNHLSFLDIFVLMSVVPMRFLSKEEVKRYPLIGWMATAVGTVFVNRSDKESRKAAREKLSKLHHYPPIVIFPEGGIFPPATEIKPFRFGAFEIVAERQTPFIPCVLIYEPLNIIFWNDEPLTQAIWRFASYNGPIHVHMHVLKTITPTPEDDAKSLALETHGAMTAVLKYHNREDDILSSGL